MLENGIEVLSLHQIIELAMALHSYKVASNWMKLEFEVQTYLVYIFHPDSCGDTCKWPFILNVFPQI